MEARLADQLIRDRQDLVHIRLIDGPYLSCHLKYDPSLTDKCFDIPSWAAVYGSASEPNGKRPFKYYRIHMFDLKRINEIVNSTHYELHFDEGLYEYLSKVRDEYRERLELKKAPVEELMVKGLRRPLRVYQQIGAQFMSRAGRCLNADGMGSGKSAQAVGAVMLNRQRGEPHRALVACPASIKEAWRREFVVMSDMRVLILDSNIDKRQAQYEDIASYDVVIVGFEGFLADYEDIAQLFQPNILILDEAHRICNRTNRITQVMVGGKLIRKTFPSMCKMLHSIYLLTGTPITNKLEDLYTLLRLMDPGLLNWRGFANRYTLRETKTRWEHKVIGGRKVAKPREYSTIEAYQNEEELKNRLDLYMIRRTKDKILPELPPKIYQTIEVDLDPEERGIYDSLRDNYKAAVRGKMLSVVDQLTWLTRAQQICDSLELIKGSNAKKSTKLEELKRIVNEQVGEHKIVVFSKYHEMTKIICRDLAHLDPIHFNGSVPSADRPALIDDFQTNPKKRLFVSTLGAGGVGITLTAADIVIFYDRWWSPGQNTQAADRLHRIGQEHESVLVVSLRVRDSVEEYIERTWLEKAEIIAEMVDDDAVIKKLTRDELDKLI